MVLHRDWVAAVPPTMELSVADRLGSARTTRLGPGIPAAREGFLTDRGSRRLLQTAARLGKHRQPPDHPPWL